MEEQKYTGELLPGEVNPAAEGADASSAEEKEKKEHSTVLDGVPRSRGWSVVSFAAGIISIICAIICLIWQTAALPFVSMGFGVSAILFSILSRHNLGYFDGMAVAGIITGAMGLVFGLGDYLIVALF